MKKIGIFVCTLALVATMLPTPQAHAQSPVYYSYAGTQQELLNYLYQLIAQLQQQLAYQQQNSYQQVYYYGPNTPNYHKEIKVVGNPRGYGSGSSNDDEPEVETLAARDIEDDRAELRGEVDMNDFNNGLVFFVYGEDEDQVDDIADDYDEYRDIDEDGDDLQKVTVDSDLDGDSTYYADLRSLDDDTEYYFQICVEYEDEDDDPVIECGGTEDFETDN